MPYQRPEPGKPILVEINGSLHELRFSLKTLKALDTDHHISIFKENGILTAYQEPGRMAIVLHYGLRERNPQCTQDWVEEHVDASMLLDLIPILGYAATGKWVDVDSINPPAPRPNVESPEPGLR